jgi:hypothetical protein
MMEEVKKQGNGSDTTQTRTPLVGERKAVKRVKKRAKKDKGRKRVGLKYGFDKLEKGGALTVPHADGKAGKVTVYEDVRRLAYEFGKLHDVKFEVEKKRSRVLCTRIK